MMICIRMMTDQLIDEDMRSDVIVRVVVGKESGMNMHTIRYYTREQSFTLALWLSGTAVRNDPWTHILCGLVAIRLQHKHSHNHGRETQG